MKWVSPPTFVNGWVTAENVEATVARQNLSGPIDRLSLDLDGNDYWIWKALECVIPRVVVLEFNAACGPQQCVTCPISPILAFNAFFVRNGLGEELLPELSARECYERTERLRTWHSSSLDAMLSGPPMWQQV